MKVKIIFCVTPRCYDSINVLGSPHLKTLMAKTLDLEA